MIAEYERAQIAERSRRGKRHRAQQGSINVLSGAPYGYRYVRKSDTSAAYYEIIDSEAAVVRRVYAVYTQQGLSINAIARLLNEEHIPTRTETTRWERSTVWGMLRNPAYRGRACCRDSANHERPRPDWIEIAVPALVSEETFALAQEQLEQNKRHSPRRTIEPSLLQGMLVCECCGYALYRTSTQTSVRKLYYYRCLGSDAYRHLRGAVCDNPPVRQDHLDAVVWKELLRLLEDPGAIREELNRRLEAARRIDPLKQREESLQREQARLEKSMDRLLNAYQEGLVSLEQLRGRMPELRKQQQAVQAEQQSLETASADHAHCLRLVETLHRLLRPVAVEGGHAGGKRTAENPASAGERDLGGQGDAYHPPFRSDTECRARSGRHAPPASRASAAANTPIPPTLSFAFRPPSLPLAGSRSRSLPGPPRASPRHATTAESAAVRADRGPAVAPASSAARGQSCRSSS
jgi:site-specific DNA recombinase